MDLLCRLLSYICDIPSRACRFIQIIQNRLLVAIQIAFPTYCRKVSYKIINNELTNYSIIDLIVCERMTSEESKGSDKVVAISPISHAKIILHAVRHSYTSIHGILIGYINGDSIQVNDVLPVCHSSPTKPILDMALRIANAYAIDSGVKADESRQQQIVGWYTANERVGKNDEPGQVSNLKKKNCLFSEKFDLLFI